MKRCQKCKNELVAEARYCNICGAPQQPLLLQQLQQSELLKKTASEIEAGDISEQVAQIIEPAPAARTIQPIVRRIPITRTRDSKPTTVPLDTPEQQPIALADAAPTAQLKQPQQPAQPVQTPAVPLSQQEEITSAIEPATPQGIIRPIRPIVSSSSLRKNTPPPLVASEQSPTFSAKQHLKSPGPPPSVTPHSLPTTPLPSSPPTPRARSIPPALPNTPIAILTAEPLQPQAVKSASNGAHATSNGTSTADHQNATTYTPYSPESFAYTSVAAEHWRNSWRDRQYAEAGPAEDVSKGQASVPAPLAAMQNSFIRMRAVVANQKQDKRKMSLGFWVTIFLMVCMIGGLGAYIFYSYLPNAGFNATPISQTGTGGTPSMVIVGPSTTFKQGQALTVQGEHFGAGDTITFLLDTTTPILGINGKSLAIKANNQGAFKVAILVSTNWPIGSRIIQAIDARANLSSYLVIQVNLAGKAETSSPNLSISLNDQPLSMLPFTTQIGQPDPPAQRITITNTSGAPLQWTASASTVNNLGWLAITDNTFAGQLNIAEFQTLGISINSTGLTPTAPKKPYKGQILFTINGKEILTLAVQLTIANLASEFVFSPQPLVATANADGTCQAGITLTLINMGPNVLHWTVNPDQGVKNNIWFVNSQGVVTEVGDLAASGLSGDTVVLSLQCKGVQKNLEYHVSIYANSIHASEMVIIQ